MVIINSPIPPQRIVILTAPSGAGKTTLRKEVLATVPDIDFVTSRCTRELRINEISGHDYLRVSHDEFKRMIANDEFAEFEEVYPGKLYGTPHSEIQRIINAHHAALLDIDVYGAAKIKRKYPDAKIIFIKPPSLEVLRQRITDRKDTKIADLKTRMKKAPEELAFGEKMVAYGIFDAAMTNGDLEEAKIKIRKLVTAYIGQYKTA